MTDFAYFQAEDSEQFTFFRVPKVLFTDPAFAGVSTEAKLLYGVMLDRVGLSQKNGWVDEQGNVYIQFTIAEMMSYLHWTRYRIYEILRELDAPPEGVGLIERRRVGITKPNVIYVKNFASVLHRNRGAPGVMSEQSDIKTSEYQTSGRPNVRHQDIRQSDTNNTESNNTENNNTDLMGVRREYGQFSNVQLSDREMKELRRRFPDDWQSWIERLSSYIASTGKCYRSHYATICSWAIRERKMVQEKNYDVPEGMGL